MWRWLFGGEIWSCRPSVDLADWFTFQYITNNSDNNRNVIWPHGMSATRRAWKNVSCLFKCLVVCYQIYDLYHDTWCQFHPLCSKNPQTDHRTHLNNCTCTRQSHINIMNYKHITWLWRMFKHFFSLLHSWSSNHFMKFTHISSFNWHLNANQSSKIWLLHFTDKRQPNNKQTDEWDWTKRIVCGNCSESNKQPYRYVCTMEIKQQWCARWLFKIELW